MILLECGFGNRSYCVLPQVWVLWFCFEFFVSVLNFAILFWVLRFCFEFCVSVLGFVILFRILWFCFEFCDFVLGFAILFQGFVIVFWVFWFCFEFCDSVLFLSPLSTRKSKTQLPWFRNRCDKHHYHCSSFSLVCKSRCFYSCFCIACYCFSCNNFIKASVAMLYRREASSIWRFCICQRVGVYWC